MSAKDLHRFFIEQIYNRRLSALAKIITVNRKFFVVATSLVIVCVLIFAGFSVWNNTEASSNNINTVPEIKMLSVTVEPTSVVKNLTYGSITLKDVQVISSKSFDLIATVQNTTANKMTNVPVELQVTLIGDDSKKVIKPGTIPVLEPGATAKIAFRKINALGDALGKSATDGQHLMTISIKKNPTEGVNQQTEASFRFTVDSTVKVPAQ